MTDSVQSELEQIQNWRLTIAYDGTGFHGWQVQPGKPTIQGEIQRALEQVVGECPLPQGSGRTDAGVHALAQVASFSLRAHIPAHNLLRALNRSLAPSIRILEAKITKSTFHARHSAIAKTYEYRIFPVEPASAQICPPFLSRYVYPYSWRLDLDLLGRAAVAFLGERDFRSFMASDPDLTMRVEAPGESQAPVAGREDRTTIRTIFTSRWQREMHGEFELLVYRVRGNGFLHHMVRNLVGTMLDVGRGYMRVEDIPAILAAGDRALAGPTAPARGLFLHSVDYDD